MQAIEWVDHDCNRSVGPGDPTSDISDPISEGPGAGRGSGRAGNSPLGLGAQGYGIIGQHPPPFDPLTELDRIVEFYAGLQNLGAENGYEIGRVRTGCLVLVGNVRYMYTPFQ